LIISDSLMLIAGRNSSQLCYWLLTIWVWRVSKSKDFRSCWNVLLLKQTWSCNFERMVMPKHNLVTYCIRNKDHVIICKYLWKSFAKEINYTSTKNKPSFTKITHTFTLEFKDEVSSTKKLITKTKNTHNIYSYIN